MAGFMYPEARDKPTVDLYSLGALLWQQRISAEFGAAQALKRFEANTKGGTEYAPYDILRDLYEIGKAVNTQPTVTNADKSLSALVRKITAISPSSRGSIDELIESLEGVTKEEPLLLDQVWLEGHAESVRDLRLSALIVKSRENATIDLGTTLDPDDYVSWAYSEGTLMLGPEPILAHLMGLRMTGWTSKPRMGITMGRASGQDVPWREIADNVIEVIVPITYSQSDGSPVFSKPESLRGWFEGFRNCRSFDLSGLDVSQVLDMSRMFKGCSSVRRIVVPAHWDLSRVQSMELMFSGCINLEEVSFLEDVSSEGGDSPCEGAAPEAPDKTSANGSPTGNEYGYRSPIDTSSVINFTRMFENCRSLRRVRGDGRQGSLRCRLSTNSAQYMDGMFAGCSDIRCLDLRAFDTSKVTGMVSMFEGCASLVLIKHHFDVRSLRWSSSMFRGCSSLKSFSFGGDMRGFLADGTTKSLRASGMFIGCESLESLVLGELLRHPIIDAWHMFERCGKLKRVDLTGMDTSGVKDLSGMFLGCESLERIDGIEGLRTESAESFGMMFSGCASLERLDLHKWHTARARSFGHMFRNCRNLREIDVTGWQAPTVISISRMFEGSNNLERIIGIKDLTLPMIDNPSNYTHLT